LEASPKFLSFFIYFLPFWLSANQRGPLEKTKSLIGPTHNQVLTLLRKWYVCSSLGEVIIEISDPPNL
jgi:hypothetical protein